LLSSRIVYFAILSNLETMARCEETRDRGGEIQRDFAWRKRQDRRKPAVGGKAADAHRKVSSGNVVLFLGGFLREALLFAQSGGSHVIPSGTRSQ
jgi:hypothetical protein